jgi:hypothetical protein
VTKLITPEALLDLLQNGRPPTMENVPSIEGLSSEALRNLWRVYLNSELGIGRFFVIVPVDKPADESFRLQFCLRGWTGNFAVLKFRKNYRSAWHRKY